MKEPYVDGGYASDIGATSLAGSKPNLFVKSALINFLDIKEVVLYYALLIAGWSSPVARRAHNPKVVGSNPAPATNQLKGLQLKL